MDNTNVIPEYFPSNYGLDSFGNPGIAGISFKLRRNTSAGWASLNPTPMQGEPCAELLADGRIKFKIGDGVTAWNSLPYAIGAIDDGELN